MELNSELDRLKKYEEIDCELIRAKELHPDYPKSMFKQLAIMQEEAGEVTKAVLDYHYKNGGLSNIKEELIQTAAMCMRMLQEINYLINN
jgi:NTP pyrophosphatase (non-canonical NTP hydrolase)